MRMEHTSALWWLLLAIPVVLLHFGLRKRRQRVSTTFLWRRALARRTWWQRMRRPVSLGVHLLFLLLVIGALTEPVLWDGQYLATWFILAATSLIVLEWGLFQRHVTE